MRISSKVLSINYIILFLLTCCTKDTFYTEYRDIEGHIWKYKEPQHFNFKIENTIPKYILSTTIRYGLSYPYYNIFIQYFLLYGKDTLVSNRVDRHLMDSKTGRPLGEGGHRVFYIKFPLFEYKFKNTGTYQFILQQYMRNDSLREIYNVGVLIEKVKSDE